MKKIALGVGYSFVIVDSDAANRINLRKTNTIVKVDEECYPIHVGTTYEESTKIDNIMDSGIYKELRIHDFKIN